MGYSRREMLPENRGFETHFGYLNGAEDHYDRTVCTSHFQPEKPRFCGIDFRDNGQNRNISGMGADFPEKPYLETKNSLIGVLLKPSFACYLTGQ